LATKMLASTVQFSRYGRSRYVIAACTPSTGCVVPRRTGPVPRPKPLSRRSTRGFGRTGLEVRATSSLPQDPTAYPGRSPS